MSDSSNKRTTVALVGHCGPDSSYLRMAVSKAIRESQVVMVDDQSELNKLLSDGADLILMNRLLDYGFEEHTGADLIRKLKTRYPNARYMLISNYAEAQRDAEAAGAIPGFGKREIGTDRVTQLLREAVKSPVEAE